MSRRFSDMRNPRPAPPFVSKIFWLIVVAGAAFGMLVVYWR